MNIPGEKPINTDEVDLRKLLLTIAHRWKLILIFLLVGGLLAGAYHFLKKPVFQASSIISIDSSILLTKTSPLFLIQSDEIKQEVAQTLVVSIEELPEVSFSNDKLDKTIIVITARSSDKKLSQNTVNAWAEISIKHISNLIQSLQSEIKSAQAMVDSSDSDLAAFLRKSRLEHLSWVDLLLITGIGDMTNISIVSTEKEYPLLNTPQKLELANLIRQKMLAEWNFTRINQTVMSISVSDEARATVLNRASLPEDRSLLSGYLLIALGVILGFIASVIWILLRDWWRNSSDVEPKKE